jgi:hypothetical protein
MKTVGRPTKYDEAMLAKAQSYVQHCQDAKEIPFIEELALLLDIHDDTIVEWSKNNVEFSATVKRLKMLQKLHLKKGALEKRLHPSLAIFLLKANHGLDEKSPNVQEPITVIVKHLDSVDKVIADMEKARKNGVKTDGMA